MTLDYRPGSQHSNADAMSRQSWADPEADSTLSGVSAFSSGQCLVGGDVGVVMRENGDRDRNIEKDRDEK